MYEDLIDWLIEESPMVGGGVLVVARIRQRGDWLTSAQWMISRRDIAESGYEVAIREAKDRLIQHLRPQLDAILDTNERVRFEGTASSDRAITYSDLPANAPITYTRPTIGDYFVTGSAAISNYTIRAAQPVYRPITVRNVNGQFISAGTPVYYEPRQYYADKPYCTNEDIWTNDNHGLSAEEMAAYEAYDQQEE